MYIKILQRILKLKADKLIQAGLMLPLWQQIIFEEFSFSYEDGCAIFKLFIC